MDDSGVLCAKCGSRGHNTAGHEDQPKNLRYTPWAQEQIEFLISQILPGSSKAEFLKWVEEAWDEMDESYQDHLSRPGV